MAGGKKVTGKKADTAASRVLQDDRTGSASKSAAGSALSQREKRKKRASKLPRGRVTLAFVTCFDASYEGGECTSNGLLPQAQQGLQSAGLLVQNNGKTVSIALDSYIGDRTCRYIEHIPKANIGRLRCIKFGPAARGWSN